jgi:type VI secretion system secreted protein VgrG
MTIDAMSANSLFELEAAFLGTNELRVVSFRGREKISSLYAFDVLVESELDWQDVYQPLLSSAACLTIHGPHGASRRVRGIVNRIAAIGRRTTRAQYQYRLRIVPRMWLLTQRRGSRVFQDTTISDIVSTILGAKNIPYRWATTTALAERTYCVQYEETDFEFVSRLLAQQGIFYFFESLDPSATVSNVANAVGAAASGEFDAALAGSTDVVVLGDAASSYLPLPSGNGVMTAAAEVVATVANAIPGADALGSAAQLIPAPSLAMRRDEDRQDRECVHRFGLKRQVRASKMELRDYEYERPRYQPRGTASSAKLGGFSAGALLDPETLMASAANLAPDHAPELTVYAHRAEAQESEANDWSARVYLEQLRAEAALGIGKSNSRRLAPGFRFTLEDSADGFEAEYVVTAIRHRGVVPERMPSDADRSRPYANRFECVKSRIVFRPPRPAIRIQQVLETATVVGPGQDGSVHTDELGRIKVHFHWDREGEHNVNASCWIRVSQAWAGQAMGFQFIPRVGMEVVVGFLGGDVDRPVVLGAAYNATHPVPFPLPDKGHVSGIRTQTIDDVRSSGKFNEISFDDTAERELLSLRAERDCRVSVGHDQLISVGRDYELTVGSSGAGNIALRVQDAANAHVTGDAEVYVRGNSNRVILEDSSELVSGTQQVTLGARDVHVRRNDSTRIEADRLVEVGGGSVKHVAGNETVSVEGQLAMSAGAAWTVGAMTDATIRAGEVLRLASGSSFFELSKDQLTIRAKSIVLSADSTLEGGETSLLQMGNDSIFVSADNELRLTGAQAAVLATEKGACEIAGEIATLAADEVHAAAKGAKLGLADKAELLASAISLKAGSGETASNALEFDPLRTSWVDLELADDEGLPIPGGRYEVVMADGRTVYGTLDAAGRARVAVVPGSVQICYPEFDADAWAGQDTRS